MLTNIHIEAYRGLNDIEITGLSEVNAIIGKNNFGKTSILEALQLIGSTDILNSIIFVARKRERGLRKQLAVSNPFDRFFYSFPFFDKESSIGIEASGQNEYFYKASVTGQLFFKAGEYTSGIYKKMDGDEPRRMLSGRYHIEESLDNALFDGEYDFIESENAPSISEANGHEVVKGGYGIRYISPVDTYMELYNDLLSKGLTKAREDEILNLLQMFDERIIHLANTSYGNYSKLQVELLNVGLVPLSVFGEGMKNVLSIATALEGSQNGILLIDEFEVGLHKKAMVKVLEWLILEAKKRNTQIFLTTHSGDAFDALLDIAKKGHSFSAYRMESFEGTKICRRYDGTELISLREAQGTGIL